VRHHRTGIKRIHHPEVGDLEFACEAMDLPLNPDWFLFAYTAEPGSPTEERLMILGSLAASSTPGFRDWLQVITPGGRKPMTGNNPRVAPDLIRVGEAQAGPTRARRRHGATLAAVCLSQRLSLTSRPDAIRSWFPGR
jgi:hypothetical protein